MENLILDPTTIESISTRNVLEKPLVLGVNTEEFDGCILPKTIQNQMLTNKDFISTESALNIFGFAKANNTNNTCGPASMATIMNYYGFGWNDIGKDSFDGEYDNEQYVKRIMEWSGAPDALFGLWGTTPMRIVDSMKRLNLEAIWYANGNDIDTMNFIKSEIDQNRPVYILVDYGQINPDNRFVLDWQVAYGYDDSNIYCKVSDFRNNDKIWDNNEFQKVMQNSLPGWNRSLIVVRK